MNAKQLKEIVDNSNISSCKSMKQSIRKSRNKLRTSLSGYSESSRLWRKMGKTGYPQTGRFVGEL